MSGSFAHDNCMLCGCKKGFVIRVDNSDMEEDNGSNAFDGANLKTYVRTV